MLKYYIIGNNEIVFSTFWISLYPCLHYLSIVLFIKPAELGYLAEDLDARGQRLDLASLFGRSLASLMQIDKFNQLYQTIMDLVRDEVYVYELVNSLV